MVDPIVTTTAAAVLAKSAPALARFAGKWLIGALEHSPTIKISGASGTREISISHDNMDSMVKVFRNTSDKLSQVSVAPTKPEQADAEALSVALVQMSLTRMHERLGSELPRARARNRLAKRLRLCGSLIALASNVAVLTALGVGNSIASIAAAVVALLVSSLKIIEDYLIAGVTGKQPQRLQELVIETNRLWFEAGEVLDSFRQLAAANAPASAYPLADANRIAKELIQLIPEMELTGD